MSDEKERERASKPSFYVVVIGFSAGGLKPVCEFLNNLDPGLNCSYIITSHEAQDSPHLLPQIISHSTPLPIARLDSVFDLSPRHIYLYGQRKEVRDSGLFSESEGCLGKESHSIDRVFELSANRYGERTIGVVFSGFGKDGSKGISCVKKVGGHILVQDPLTAEFSSMPASAIASEKIDAVLPPKQLASRLASIIEATKPNYDLALSREMSIKVKICDALVKTTGKDFSLYKSNSFFRRLQKRMSELGISDEYAYLEVLKDSCEEANELVSELLIQVTSFFRDPEVWNYYAAEQLPRLLSQNRDKKTVRVWIPACSTGEEAYSLTILFLDYFKRTNKDLDLQVLATDVDENAISIARQGTYHLAKSTGIPKEFLARYFTKKGEKITINRDVRKLICFAQHNVLFDPPYSHIDLISCRNLLIYLKPNTQAELIKVFHYALVNKGNLILGTSESIANLSHLFVAENKKYKIYRKLSEETGRILPPILISHEKTYTHSSKLGDTHLKIINDKPMFSTAVSRYLSRRFAPTSLLVSDAGEILFTHGDIGKYLELTEGIPMTNIVDMAKPGLKNEIDKLIKSARTSDQILSSGLIQLPFDSHPNQVKLTIEEVSASEILRGMYLITFQEVTVSEAEVPSNPIEPTELSSVKILERDLQLAKESYHVALEELEVANIDLRASNDEFQSANEELQSANEELETSKEEMHSLYEELNTTNAQLEEKVTSLTEAHNDIQNLLNSTDMAIIFLDKHLNIRRFTKRAKDIMPLKDIDKGRPIQDIASKVENPTLVEDAYGVLKTLEPVDIKLESKQGDQYVLRIIPYRTIDNVVDGLVLNFIHTSLLQK